VHPECSGHILGTTLLAHLTLCLGLILVQSQQDSSLHGPSRPAEPPPLAAPAEPHAPKVPEPPPEEPNEPPKPPEEEEAPVAPARAGVHFIATVTRHQVSTHTYGGDDEPTLVPNTITPLVPGSLCLISVWPTPEPETCDLRVVCGSSTLFAAQATPCQVLRWTRSDGSDRTDVAAHSRTGTCNGGTFVDLVTSEGKAVVVGDSSYGGPAIETERVHLKIASPAIVDKK
jgi:hypothetical protein